jgi:hypothetical protein
MEIQHRIILKQMGPSITHEKIPGTQRIGSWWAREPVGMLWSTKISYSCRESSAVWPAAQSLYRLLLTGSIMEILAKQNNKRSTKNRINEISNTLIRSMSTFGIPSINDGLLNVQNIVD